MTLYLTYRPQKLDDLDLENPRETIKKIITSGDIPHAFLFSGPKGTGKTSAARILAKVINCENRKPDNVEPCNECSNCKAITKGESLDVIEMDAASNRGIDDIRNLKDAVKLSPVSSKMKVYIIDEAHMLTNEASNALLKTLEEPPAHVIFILATTNPEKIIETVRSRTVNVVFKKASEKEILRSLNRVFSGEKITVENEVSLLLAKLSKGSLRDAHKLLEQVITSGVKLDVATVSDFLNLGKESDPMILLDFLNKGRTQAALMEIERISQMGLGLEVYTETLLAKLRESLLAKNGIGEDPLKNMNNEDVVHLIRLFTVAVKEIKGALIEQLPLELAVIEWGMGKSSLLESDNGPLKAESPTTPKQEEEKENKDKIDTSADTVNGVNAADISNSLPVNHSNDSNNGESGFPVLQWSRILAVIRPKNASTEALLRAAKPLEYDGKTLKLGVFYSFHKEKLEGNPHRLLLEEAIASVIGNEIRVVCTLTQPETAVRTTEEVVLTESEDEDIIRVAKDIFNS